ncbi:hypothetical protein QEZ54_33050 [Catellatospora sp. KI3]|uniref:hypothetical protein n=1 Tax=Catellatospora sp. KI3 TaxID=3041620 RepID=UPI00248307A4|nr:hypothetical protein [Catellatospora sp. KI3]MDI1465811.1 hypothetical protein [Catellatospora sp. KI3]
MTPYQAPDPYDPNMPAAYLPQGFLPPVQPITGADYDPYTDPLVPPPNMGVSGWFDRVGGVLKRSWKSIAGILAVTHVLPGLLFTLAVGVLTAVFAASMVSNLSTYNTSSRRGELPFDGGVFVLVILAAIVVGLISYMIQMVGYAGATYATTREAAGIPVRLGEALGYGFRRGMGLFGWQLLVGLLCVVAVLLCFLPALYVIPATALVGPIFLFERQRPLARSFEIFNRNLGRVLGRLALVLVALIVGSILTNLVESVVQAVVGGGVGGLSGGNSDAVEALSLGAGAIVAVLFSTIIQLPITMVQFAGILVTYTEQRGHEGANTARLVAELN